MNIVYKKDGVLIKYRINNENKIDGLYVSNKEYDLSDLTDLFMEKLLNGRVNSINNSHYFIAKFKNGLLLKYRYKSLQIIKELSSNFHISLDIVKESTTYNEYNDNGEIIKIVFIKHSLLNREQPNNDKLYESIIDKNMVKNAAINIKSYVKLIRKRANSYFMMTDDISNDLELIVIPFKNNKIHGKCRIVYYFTTDKIHKYNETIHTFEGGVRIKAECYGSTLHIVNKFAFKKYIIPFPKILSWKDINKSSKFYNIFLMEIKMFYTTNYYDTIIKVNNC